MLAEAVTERDQAIVDRDAALAQKLEMSRRRQRSEDRLSDLLRRKTAVQEQLSHMVDRGEGGSGGEDAPDLPQKDGKENRDPGRGRPDPLLRRIIAKLEDMDRTRTASQPGTPTVSSPGFSNAPRESGETQQETAKLRAECDHALQEPATCRLGDI